MQTLIVLSIALGIVVLCGIFRYIIKKFKGETYVNIVTYIATTIRDALYNAGIATDKFKAVYDAILQAIILIQVTSNANTDINVQIEDALGEVETITSKLGIALTDDEILLIKQVLNIGLLIVDNLPVTTTYSKLYRKLAKASKASQNVLDLAPKYLRK